MRTQCSVTPFGNSVTMRSQTYNASASPVATHVPPANDAMSLLIWRHINKDIASFAGGTWVATGEALALYVWDRIVTLLPKGVTLHCVRIEESPHLYSEYRGEP